jgi:ligand-binding sensor domain-containing protein/signal transduction histidine kinase
MVAWAFITRTWGNLALWIRTFCFSGSASSVAGSGCATATIFGWMSAIVLVMQLGAAAQDFQVRSWQVEDGLPDGTVTSLAQTPDGYLWVGTRKGLVRFDGDNFKRFEPSGDTRNSGIVNLLTDRQGGLWIAGQSGLITRFAEGKFNARYLPDDVISSQERANAQAWQNLNSILAEDADGNVWALTITGDVIRFASAGIMSKVPTDGLPAGNIRGLASDGMGRVWLLKGTNACVFDKGSWMFSGEGRVAPSSQLLGRAGDDGFLTAEMSGSDARIRTLKYQSGDGWKVVLESIPTTPARPAVMAMLQETDGRLWLSQQWGGIYLRHGEGEWTHLKDSGPLSKCTAGCLFKDSQGSVWIGTSGQGLSQVYEPSVKVTMLPEEAATMHVTTISAARDGGFWAGTDEGLYYGIRSSPSLRGMVTGFPRENIFSVLEDSRTNLWIGTRSGLFRRNDRDFQRVLSVPTGGILALYEDRAGGIWAAGPRGVLLHRPGGGSDQNFEPVACSSKYRISCITEDAKGQIWVGTGSAVMLRVEGKKLVPDGPPSGALGAAIRAVLFDKEGALWMGTLGDGLFRWNNNLLQHYTTEDGLPDDVILGLVADDFGNLWMTSHNGIIGCSHRQLADFVRGHGSTLLCQHLGIDEGLPDGMCSGAGQPVISSGKDGWLWAATMVGVAGFIPKTVTSAASAREVYVEALRTDGVAVERSGKGFRASASTRRYEFQFSTPELAAPRKLRFRYRLDGLDLDWVDAGSARRASYSQLPPGDYEFRLMVGGADGVWREARKPVPLRVIPRFWQTGWFRGLSVTTFVLTLSGVGIWNERRKGRRRLERLEAKQAVERMRQSIARDLHDELGSSITEIIQLGDLSLHAEPGPEKLRESVKGMTRLMRQLGITLDEIVWTMSARNDTLPNLVGYISNHAQEFLRNSGIRCRLDVMRNLPEVTVNSQKRHNLFLAVKEALNNAIKHSGADEVMVRVVYTKDILRVSIEDNGRGFDMASAQKGEGLTNMKERLELVGGQAEILSLPKGGTRVLFTVRLGEAQSSEGDENHQ